MKSKLVLLVLALVMAGSFTTAAVALVRADDGKDDKTTHEKRDKHADKKDRGNGPPPWAGRQEDGEKRGGHRADQAWKDYWRGLSPEQRAQKMAELAQEHADGMKSWADCVKAAGEDRAKRADCERPLPPGKAKKLLRP